MFWVISVSFNIRNTLPKSGTFLLGHPVYAYGLMHCDGRSTFAGTSFKSFDNFLFSYFMI